MAMPTDPDPWNWSVEDVQIAFQPDAVAQLTNDLPYAKLPPLNQFLEFLRENDVAGATLLTAVDDSFLRGDCGIKSLGVRNTVLHCIGKLRDLSRQSRAQNEPTGFGTPVSAIQRMLSDEQQEPALTEVNTAQTPRAGGTYIEDQGGRKRRRLDLTANQSIDPVTAQSSGSECLEVDILRPDELRSYLPSSKHAVDGFFFGTTATGKELAQIHLSHPLASHDPSNEDGNFEYLNSSIRRGTADYAYSQLRHFLVGREEEVLQRRGRDALAVYPYRSGLIDEGDRSAIVIQPGPNHQSVNDRGEEDDFVATRESAALLSSGALDLGYSAEQVGDLIGDSNYLLDKYRSSEIVTSDDEESWAGDDNNTASINDDGPRGDDEASEEEETSISADETKDIVAAAIYKAAEDWREKKLARLEAKEAWAVWRKTKESKTIRDGLIGAAQATVEQLEHRLAKIRADIERDSWDSKDGLLKQCEVMHATVEDREMQLWKISVWQRRRRPANPNSKKFAKKPAARSSGFEQRADGLQHALRALGSDDRMSISPEPEYQTLPAADDSATTVADGERFFTPENSPTPHGREDPFIVADQGDEADESDQASEEESAASEDGADGDGDTAMRDREVLESEPQVEHISTDGPPNTPGANVSPVTNETRASTPAKCTGALTKPNSFTPNKRIITNVVDLTLDSSSPTPKKKVKGLKAEPTGISSKGTKAARGRPEVTTASDDATVAEVDAWDYEELRDQKDRRRMLIKLLRDAGPEFLEGIAKRFQVLMRERFLKQLSAATRLLSGQTLAAGDLDSFQQDVMVTCARLAYAFHLGNPDIVEMEVLPEGVIEQTPNDDDLSRFLSIARQLWNKRRTKLFVDHRPVSSDDPYVVSSGSNEEAEVDVAEVEPSKLSSSKKKKRKVAMSRAAEDTRTAALKRVERFTDIQTQRSNPSQLQDMVTSETSSGIEINVARDDEHDPIYIHPSLTSRMKPHQIEGVQFMWREITAADDRGKAQGCLLAHTMGLGKTLQSITLMLTIDEVSRSQKESVYTQLPKSLRLGSKRNKRHLRFLVICPSGLLQNWRKEINQWSPRGAFGGFVATIETTSIRPGCQSYLDVLQDWSTHGGILLIGYAIFRMLLNPSESDEITPAKDLVDRVLRQQTELVVADEAHAMKNLKSGTAVAAAKLTTESRIALTGTPMSNDVPEIYALVSWVAPGYLGEPREFSGRFTIPIREGLYRESTSSEKRLSLKKLAVLHKEIDPKINRADITVLRGSLKPKTEFVIMVELTEVQSSAYSRFIEALTGNGRNQKASQVAIFAWLAILSLLTNHPYCYRQKLLTPVPKGKKAKATPGQGAEALELPEDLELVGVTVAANKASDANVSDPGSPGSVPDINIDEQDIFALGFTEPIVQALVQDLREDIDPALSAKARVFGRILQLAQQCKDKTLVFSSSIPTLNYLGRIIQRQNMSCGRIDGSVDMKKRSALVQGFERGEFDVFLISTRAGGQGLNLPAANRVVIFDFSFNPSWEQQAIGRAYRLGQTKPVFVYRFVVAGTFELTLYNTQLFKTSLASRVVDKKNPERNALRNVREYLFEPQPVVRHNITEWLGKDPQILDKIINEQMSRGEIDRSFDICHINTMETLQQEEASETLTALEIQEVQDEVAMGPAARQSRRAAMGLLSGSMGIPGMSIASTAPAGFHDSAAAALRFAANQFGINPTAGASSQAHGTPRNVHFAAQDIRNGSHMPPPSATQPANRVRALGGLPFVRSPSPPPPNTHR